MSAGIDGIRHITNLGSGHPIFAGLTPPHHPSSDLGEWVSGRVGRYAVSLPPFLQTVGFWCQYADQRHLTPETSGPNPSTPPK